MRAFQKVMRDAEAAHDPRPADLSLDYTVGAVSRAEAQEFILRYEWLGTAGHPVACYGARNVAGELVAVASFGTPAATHAGNFCGPDYEPYAICLERGACAHWAHPHTASWFIPRAVTMAAQDFGWRIFYAYADPAAGETGVIYRACNWQYVGQGSPGRMIGGKPRDRCYFRKLDWPKGKWIDERTFFGHRCLTLNELRENNPRHGKWEREFRAAKHKYVWIERTWSRVPGHATPRGTRLEPRFRAQFHPARPGPALVPLEVPRVGAAGLPGRL